jgi:predicted phosphodiesterase
LSYAGQVTIPKMVLDRNEHILLHISDTPSNFYGGLKKLIKQISPEYIIHTGDFVDDVKLEIRPYKLWLYKKKAIKLLKILEASDAQEIHIVLGNHDDRDVLMLHAVQSKISEIKSLIIENQSFNISHYSHARFEEPASFHLFGHDLSMESSFDSQCWHLNGISAINIIFLDSGAVITLPYPYGTDSARQKNTHIGF